MKTYQLPEEVNALKKIKLSAITIPFTQFDKTCCFSFTL